MSQFGDHWGHRVRIVRDHLRNYDEAVSPGVAQFLENELPKSWQALIREHGHQKVFQCLRCEMTIGGAMFYLREGRTA